MTYVATCFLPVSFLYIHDVRVIDLKFIIGMYVSTWQKRVRRTASKAHIHDHVVQYGSTRYQ